MTRVSEWKSVRGVWECDLVPSFCLTFRHFLLGTTSMTGLVTVEGGQVKTFWKPVSRWERNLKNSHTLTLPLSLDMLNNLCFHLYAQKSLFIAENVNAFLGHQWFSLTKLFISTRSSEMTVLRAGSQLKKAMIFQPIRQNKSWTFMVPRQFWNTFYIEIKKSSFSAMAM